MAARNSTSIFVGVFLTIVTVLALAFLVTTIVFASRATEAREAADAAIAERNQVLRGATDATQTFARSLAESQGMQGELEGAIAAYRNVAQFAGGRSNQTPAEVRRRAFGRVQQAAQDVLESASWAQSGMNDDLATELRDLANADPDDSPELSRALETIVLALGQSIEDRIRLEADFATTTANAEQAIRRLDDVRSEFESFRQQQISRVDGYGRDVEDYSDDVTEAQQQFRSEASRIRSESEALIAERDREINRLIDEVTALQSILDTFDRGNIIVTPKDEDLLTDGTIVGVEAGGDEAFLSLGRRDKVFPGLTFQVFDANSTIRPDDITGELPRGKATVEIIRVEESTSVARVIRRSRGNRIVEGDQLLNAIYDPNKVYRFVVFGNFDVNGDFVATPGELRDVIAIIREWGGMIDQDISGNTDFVILGERPVLPPQPKFDDPPAVLQRFAEARQAQLRYDELFDRAVSTRIPVLNQNRLFTLTGISVRR